MNTQCVLTGCLSNRQEHTLCTHRVSLKQTGTHTVYSQFVSQTDRNTHCVLTGCLSNRQEHTLCIHSLSLKQTGIHTVYSQGVSQTGTHTVYSQFVSQTERNRQCVLTGCLSNTQYVLTGSPSMSATLCATGPLIRSSQGSGVGSS